MEMKLANRESKSILAKLLASENLRVEHGKFSTASFDVKNRVLRLPIWKEMSGSLYDLLVLHEVGHALFTPAEGFHDAKGYGRGFKSFLNVVEDARIERKIKIKFPGGRRSFIEGYKNLMERDFFGIKKEETYNSESEKLSLIDRINLHYKVGDYMNLTFSDEESVFVDRIDKAQTWADVVKICEDLYEYAKENESETDMSDHDWEESDFSNSDEDFDDDYDPSDYDDFDSEESADRPEKVEGEDTEKDDDGAPVDSCEDGESGEEGESENEESEEGTEGGAGSGDEGGMDGRFEPESKTDRNFRNNETELVSEESKPYVYLNLPNNVDLKRIIVNYSDLYEDYKKIYSGSEKCRYGYATGEELMRAATEKFNDFRSKNKKVVEYLAKEFEMKKAAKEHSRAATANSGILDSERLYTYKYNEHIFKKLTVIPDGKNHGLLMFVDWSGSMSRNMKGTIEQMMVLVMFCKRVNIPFEVYAFSDSYTRYDEEGKFLWVDSDGYMTGEKIRTYGTVALNRFNLLNLFSSRMKAKQLHEAYIYMIATSHYYGSGYRYGDGIHFDIPERMHLGGTPLNATLFASFSVMREFQKKNQVDVINSIFLTDGDSHSCNQYWVGDETKHYDPYKENVIIRDSVSKKQMKIKSNGSRRAEVVTEALVRFQREVFDINIVNFFLSTRMKKWDMAYYLDKSRQARGENANCSFEEIDAALKKYRKDKFMIAPEMMGFNEQYLIQGGQNLEIEESPLEVAEDATVSQMARAFKKFSSGKLQQRRLLSRFIDMVAA